MKDYYFYGKAGLGLATLASQYFNRSRTVTLTVPKKKKKMSTMVGHEWTRSKRSTRLQRRSMKKKLYGTTQSVIDRFQGLTNFDVNSGYSALCYRKQTVTAGHECCVLPIHIFDVTQWGGNQGTPCSCMLGWEDVSNDDSDLYRVIKYGQHPNGSTAGTDNFFITKGNVLGVPAHACLDWLDLRFNLYGARKRDTLFRIQLVRFKDEFADLFQAAVSNGSAKELLTELERPLIYNNLQTGQWHEVQSRMQVIRTYTYKVPAKTADDLNNNCGNIKEVKLFVRMNKACNFDYDRGLDNFTHDDIEDGKQYESDTAGTNVRLRPQSRVYVIVSAFCPHLRTPDSAAYFQYSDHEAPNYPAPGTGFAVEVNDEPSYDYLFRRKWTTNSSVI